MTSKLWRIATAAVLVVALGASLALAAKDVKKEETANQSSTFRPAPERDGSGVEGYTPYVAPALKGGTRSLGESRSTSSVGKGELIQRSYNDVQYPSNPMRRVATRGSSIVNFSFTGMPAATASTEQYAYNGYKPTSGGSWAVLPPGACNVQDGSGTTRGFAAQSDVNPEGFILMAGRDANGQAFDNRLYYQTADLDCFWAAGSKIDQTKYKVGFGVQTHTLAEPHVEISLIGTDTIIHLVGSENDLTAGWFGKPITSGARGETAVQYFRKVNGWNGGLPDAAWSNPITIDTAGARPAIAAQRTGSKVAVIYPAITARGYTDSAGWAAPVFGGSPPPVTTLDMDMKYRQSTDGGLTFGAKQNITNYGNRTVKTYGIRTETSGLYDSNGDLHIVFRGDPWPAGIYDSGLTFFFYDFSGSVLHWSASAGAVTRVANADWGLAWNTNVCGFESGGYVNRPMISECDGNIYAVWSQTHDIKNVGNLADTINNSFADCTDLASAGRVGSANAELWMSVSSDLSGLLWDKPRNLTQTYSRNCDSATGNGLCFSEKAVSLARTGTQTNGTFTWPSAAKIDVTGSYAGTFFINALFMDDRIPGNFQTGANASNSDVKFARIACVDPVTAALISVSPLSDGYPNFVHHGAQKNITVTVQNDGNTALNVTTIGSVITSGPVGVISTSAATLTVPAGVSNTNTFQIRINNGGAVNSPGTVVPAFGYVYLKSNAANNDSVAIAITYVIADTVVLAIEDTLSTGRIRLAVSTDGADGFSGAGTVNLDYVTLGGDCDTTGTTAGTYLYSGGPLANRKTGPTSYVFTGSTFSDQIATYTWKPLVDLPGGPTDRGFTFNLARERFSTGLMVNKDTTIGCERVWFAPKTGDSTDFIIVQTRYWKLTAGSLTQVQLADVHDFDIPAANAAINVDGAETKYVWLRGTLGATAGCSPFTNRFGTTIPLGSRFSSNSSCTNDGPFGQYSINNPNDLTLSQHGSATGVIHPDTMWNRSGGFNAIGNIGTDSVDMRIITTWRHNITLNAGDTLFTWSALTTVKNGTIDSLKQNAAAACAWYQNNIRTGCTVCGCCIGVRGNVDGDPGEGVDIADLTVLVDNLFITFTPLICFEEADIVVDNSVDIADLTALVDNLFISFTPLPAC